MATRLAGAPETVNRLTTELYARIARGEISRVEVMFGRYRQGGASTIERHLLLPLDVASLAVSNRVRRRCTISRRGRCWKSSSPNMSSRF